MDDTRKCKTSHVFAYDQLSVLGKSDHERQAFDNKTDNLRAKLFAELVFWRKLMSDNWGPRRTTVY